MTQPQSELFDEALTWLDYAYSKLEMSDPHFLRNPQQEEMSKAVVQSLCGREHLLVESPTGTGKSIAYLLGGLAVRKARETLQLPPRIFIVSTATLALQQQLMNGDMPRLAKAGLLDLGLVALAQGRSNYFCSKLASATLTRLDEAAKQPELFFLSDQLAGLDPFDVKRLLAATETGRWNGDFNQYPEKLGRLRATLSVAATNCTGRRCPKAKGCGYLKARQQWQNSAILVTNHDWLLTSMSQGDSPALQEAFDVVFDEGHHLSDKALAAGTASVSVMALSKDLLPGLEGLRAAASDVPSLAGIVLPNVDAELEEGLQEFLAAVEGFVQNPGEVIRFRGAPPVEMTGPMGVLKSMLSAGVVPAVGDLKSKAAELLDGSEEAGFKVELSEVLDRCMELQRLLNDALRCFGMYCADDAPYRVLWIEVSKSGAAVVKASPLQASELLSRILWDGARNITAVLTSATLADTSGFAYVREELGVPPKAREVRLPHVFDYSKSTLTVVDMQATPKLSERDRYRQELKERLPLFINPKEGTLVLLTSWNLLQELEPVLANHFGRSNLLIQGEMATPILVAEHKLRVDAGRPSILVGVATLAEGLDLPGKYCEHVIISGIPFSVPTSPLEQALEERLGSRYFDLRSLPLATARLKQMVGRLNRRHSDTGRVTIFDSRLRATGYGKRIMKVLPPFSIKETVATP